VSRYVFKLPDLGEGTVEAEIVGWRVKPGDTVAEDDVIVEVMTEKAAVELPAPVGGRVVSTTGTAGDMVPVGAELIVFETDAGVGAAADPSAVAPPGAGAEAPRAGGQGGRSSVAAGDGGTVGGRGAVGDRDGATGNRGAGGGDRDGAAGDRSGTAGGRGAASDRGPESDRGAGGDRGGAAGDRGGGAASDRGAADDRGATGTYAAARGAASTQGATASGASRSNGAGNGHAHSERPGRVATSPAIRRRAHEAGVDLSQLSGSGPNGRILRQDFEAFVSSRSGPKLVRARPTEHRAPATDEPATEEIKVIGVRRVIAQRMSEAKRNIPHFAYVEEFDVTELESLRCHLNSKLESGTPALTYLPFIVSALVRVLRDFPQCNAQYDSERGVIIRHRAVHVGVATQTPEGLKVPVVRDAQSLSLWELAAQMRRVTEAARANKATRDELSGSTITVTSLGKLGGIASTPIINAPEVSIIGINRAVERPMVYDGAIAIRRMMNLSSSFDHRFVDGYDAAAMIQALKERIEHPATIFID
jgi:2-oxoisovalerate dehydrogenase E2 component (dihydrolipoyl transacylase)